MLRRPRDALAALAHEDVLAVNTSRTISGQLVQRGRGAAALQRRREPRLPLEVFVPVRRKDDEDQVVARLVALDEVRGAVRVRHGQVVFVVVVLERARLRVVEADEDAVGRRPQVVAEAAAGLGLRGHEAGRARAHDEGRAGAQARPDARPRRDAIDIRRVRGQRARDARERRPVVEAREVRGRRRRPR